MNKKKTVIITGPTSGLGKETAKTIAHYEGYNIILACRDLEKGEEVKKELLNISKNNNVIVKKIDISLLSSVREFVKQIKNEKEILPISAIICNAGINGRGEAKATEEGFDLVFATNHLGHFLLVNLLLPYVAAKGRIVVISSDQHDSEFVKVEWINIEKLAYPNNENPIRYQHSKLCNLYFTYELNRRLQKENSEIRINAMNPGLMLETGFAAGANKSLSPEWIKKTKHLIGSVEKSAKVVTALAIGKEYENTTGKYFDRHYGEVKSSELSYNLKNAEELWEKSLEYTDLK